MLAYNYLHYGVQGRERGVRECVCNGEVGVWCNGEVGVWCNGEVGVWCNGEVGVV